MKSDVGLFTCLIASLLLGMFAGVAAVYMFQPDAEQPQPQDLQMEIPVMLSATDGTTVYGTILLEDWDFITVATRDINVWRVHINAKIQEERSRGATRN